MERRRGFGDRQGRGKKWQRTNNHSLEKNEGIGEHVTQTRMGQGGGERKTGWRGAIAAEVCCGEGGVTSTALRRAIPFGQPVDKRMGEDQDVSKPEVIQAILEEVDSSGAATVIYEPDCTPYNKGYTLENAKKNHPENWKEVLRK